jgi:class 3 adenylate cyclase/uncharacterized membrane protein (DUF485 family)
MNEHIVSQQQRTQDFLQSKQDLNILFLVSFVVHLVGVIIMTSYIGFSLGASVILESRNFVAPIIIGGFLISFTVFIKLHSNLIAYFFFNKNRPIQTLQTEILNYPKICLFSFSIWAFAGLIISLWLISNQLAPIKSIVVHITFASFLSGSLVAILQLNITERRFQRNLFPFLLKNTRISNLQGIVRVPTYIRIQLLVVTTAIAPCIFIYLLYILNETTGTLLLYILAFTFFNAVWQGGFLLTAISQPIGQIAGKLERFRKGELEEQPKTIWRTDSIGEFSEMFDDLVDSIKDRDFIRSTFSRYLDPSLVDTILNGDNELGGNDLEASVMFADIRGFTTLSEHLNPQDVVTLLNEYFEDMVQEITATDGIPDKFLGDGLMAVWGVPSGDINHAQKACQAGIGMIQRLKIVNQKRIKNELEEIKIGIGIHSGPVIAGNIGSKKKMEYTVIGDTVNTSSRIEGMCKNLNAKLVISSIVYEKLSSAMQTHFQFAGTEQLRGRSELTTLFVYTESPEIS